MGDHYSWIYKVLIVVQTASTNLCNFVMPLVNNMTIVLIVNIIISLLARHTVLGNKSWETGTLPLIIVR